MKKIAFLFLACLAIVGCDKQAETSTRAGAEFVVDKLFTHEGCTVYRFVDGGRNRYFTNCSGSTISSYNRQVGKTHTQEDDGIVGGRHY